MANEKWLVFQDLGNSEETLERLKAFLREDPELTDFEPLIDDPEWDSWDGFEDAMVQFTMANPDIELWVDESYQYDDSIHLTRYNKGTGYYINRLMTVNEARKRLMDELRLPLIERN